MWNTRILLVLFPFGRGSCLRVAWDWDFSRQNKVVGHGHLAFFISGAEQVAHGNRGKRGECLQWFGYQVASGEAIQMPWIFHCSFLLALRRLRERNIVSLKMYEGTSQG